MSFAPVYLDWNATTPLDEVVREAMLPWLGVGEQARFGNASSRHEYGRQARAAIDEARVRVASAVGAHATEVVFTSGGSEANNLFLKGAAGVFKPALLAISAIEHPCVREPARQLQRGGWALREIGVDAQGLVDEASWQAVLAERPRLVSVMMANNETGVVQDLARIAAQARTVGAWVHTDAVQAVGKLEVDFRTLGVHALSLSAHKIGGPLGAGALIVDKRVELTPLIAGGGQERGLRSGTENVAAIVGFGVACERARAAQAQEAQRLGALREELERGLLQCGASIFSAQAPRLPNTVFFAIGQIDGETLVAKLDRAGFACASGSACSSANPEPSHTLLAMGVERGLARAAVRISLGRDTTAEQVRAFLAALAGVTDNLRNLASVAA
ncbi:MULTISPECIES: cysteine desulfurase family protein [unclassified Thauera]|uniref:cysteine desulfurase family protein n=1 Tax=unclassified Thauera TaxID=2609274 RepID=UPI000E8B31ED|nr:MULTISPECIES: cysteine desulfurase family protein [unclassified Thauera]WBL62522.1 cysteine desulfurase [Thauera sp. WB-2]HAY08692.1 cysteine desulfurase [Thauera sp.]HRJ23396.1 cysteine desulfurase family protein [Thauera sp.]HRK10375.1 cysteine desulfurase family protein [Thauera sp.]